MGGPKESLIYILYLKKIRLYIHSTESKMVKLTVDLIQGAAQYINPIRERELDLRGYKIAIIENLGATLDQFDTIDFSDNEVRRLDNFPFLPRLQSLHLNNNRIVRIGDTLHESIPKLDTLILTNNNIQDLADIEALSSCSNITMLSFLHNPVAAKPNYREFVIHKFPMLRVLDFRKVRLNEKQEAKALFKSSEGKEQLRDIKSRAQTFTPGEPVTENTNNANVQNPQSKLMPEQIRSIKAAIAKATTLEEIEVLNHMLRTGRVPGENNDSVQQGNVVEEDD